MAIQIGVHSQVSFMSNVHENRVQLLGIVIKFVLHVEVQGLKSPKYFTCLTSIIMHIYDLLTLLQENFVQIHLPDC